jgi:DNA-binding transcriptional LysR family regulator
MTSSRPAKAASRRAASSIDLLPFIAAFVAVCEEKSFKMAGVRLGVSTAAISKSVQRLEEELGSPLLERTTRSVTVTRMGQQVQQRLQSALHELDAARAVVDEARSEPRGEFVFHVSPVLSAPMLVATAALSQRHPHLVPRIEFSDRQSRPAEDDIDVAVRLGDIGDDRLVARKLADLPFVVAAAPAYVARHGRPASADELRHHDVVAFAGPRGVRATWRFGGVAVDVNPRVVVDSGLALPEAAVLGLGLVQVFDFMVAAHVRAGRLVRVLEHLDGETRPVHAVTTPAKAKTRAVRTAIECLQTAFRVDGDQRGNA